MIFYVKRTGYLREEEIGWWRGVLHEGHVKERVECYRINGTFTEVQISCIGRLVFHSVCVKVCVCVEEVVVYLW